MTSEPPPRASYEEIAYRESERLIATQLASLDELRSRTGLLLAALAVAGSFLGAAALEREEGLGVFGWMALSWFAVGVVACLWVLWPTGGPLPEPEAHPPASRAHRWAEKLIRRLLGTGYTFALSPKTLLGWSNGRYGDETRMLRHIAKYREVHYERNKRKIDRLFIAFRVASGMLGLQVIFWVLELA